MQRKDYMSEAQKRAIGAAPRSHDNCKRLLDKAGLPAVARPGKTAQDKARRGR